MSDDDCGNVQVTEFYGNLCLSNRQMWGTIDVSEPTGRERIVMAVPWFLTRLVMFAGFAAFIVFAIICGIPLEPMLIAFVFSFVFGYALNR